MLETARPDSPLEALLLEAVVLERAAIVGRDFALGDVTGLLDAAVLALMGFLLLLVIGEIKSNQQRGFFLLIGLPQPPPAR